MTVFSVVTEFPRRLVTSVTHSPMLERRLISTPTLSTPTPTSPRATESLFSPQLNHNSSKRVWRNWAENQSCVPEYFHQPNNEQEILSVIQYVRERKEKLTVVGCGHSPSDIAVTDQHMVSLVNFNRLLSISHIKQQVTVQSGMTLTDLNTILERNDLALSVLGSISDQTVGGVLGTGTHGTGVDERIISDLVVSFTLITASGEVITSSKEQNREIFEAGGINLGCLGIVSEVTIQCVPAFYLREKSFALPFHLVFSDSAFENLVHSEQYVRMYWTPHTDTVIVNQLKKLKEPEKQVYRKKHDKSGFFHRLYKNTKAALTKFIGYHLLELLLYIALFFPSFVPWINRLYDIAWLSWTRERIDRSDEIFNFDCLFKQHVTEWAIPRSETITALTQLRDLIIKEKLNCHFPVEIRFVKRDQIWLSPSYDVDTTYINILSFRPYGRDASYDRFFCGFEEIMYNLRGRPHWAKAFELTQKQLRDMYPKYLTFNNLRKKLDPSNMFCNKFIERMFKGL